VFSRGFSWHLAQRLNVQKMKAVAEKMTGKRDFSLFAKDPGSYHTCVRTVQHLSVKKRSSAVTIDIEANGFLRYMVRNIVAFLVKVGMGELSSAQALSIVRGKTAYNNKPAPACGLYLMKVKFRPELRNSRGKGPATLLSA
jgi:tRNA pseudouridine38-40 synthase